MAQVISNLEFFNNGLKFDETKMEPNQKQTFQDPYGNLPHKHFHKLQFLQTNLLNEKLGDYQKDELDYMLEAFNSGLKFDESKLISEEDESNVNQGQPNAQQKTDDIPKHIVEYNLQAFENALKFDENKINS
ncbi:unnamed protein product [Orchesella dallaii]|uniref:Uncharacterized protein n=1 Tax=Orchesella dallaii TaxID=48710 RepID=A0ABP1QCR0_9HEXA